MYCIEIPAIVDIQVLIKLSVACTPRPPLRPVAPLTPYTDMYPLTPPTTHDPSLRIPVNLQVMEHLRIRHAELQYLGSDASTLAAVQTVHVLLACPVTALSRPP